MRAMVLKGTALAVEDVNVPAPGPGQVLAKVRACGICGSDLHAAKYMDQMMSVARAQGRPGPSEAELANGIVMGHEFVAEVVTAGPGAEQWTPGTRVTSMPVLVTPETDSGMTAIGYSPVYPGAYGEFVLLSAPLVLAVPDNVSDIVAATTEPCGVGLHAVREAGLKGGESVLVMGAGPIGLMTLIWLKKEGAGLVAVSDFSPERRELAAKMGADLVIDPKTTDVATALREALTAAGKPTLPGTLGPAPDVVFEAVGVEGTLQQAMDVVSPRGTVVVVGVCMNEDRITPMTGINKQLTLKFVLGYTPQEYAEALQAFADGAVDTSPLVTRTVALDELPAAFTALADPRDCKIVVLPNG
ncbi:MAG: zinc-binding dehydrogenase [Dehalococcoidia bacterium]|nr:zinc-binding dehydrogenase [Dehalococcoidia bacterium]